MAVKLLNFGERFERKVSELRIKGNRDNWRALLEGLRRIRKWSIKAASASGRANGRDRISAAATAGEGGMNASLSDSVCRAAATSALMQKLSGADTTEYRLSLTPLRNRGEYSSRSAVGFRRA